MYTIVIATCTTYLIDVLQWLTFRFLVLPKVLGVLPVFFGINYSITNWYVVDSPTSIPAIAIICNYSLELVNYPLEIVVV